MNIEREICRRAPTLCVLMLAVMVMAGCDSSTSVQQGRIVDTAVAGLNYTTETQSGVTGPDGGFSFVAGETVSFAVGDFEIAAVPAKETINWFELAGFSEIPVGYNEVQSVLYDDHDVDGDGVYDAPSLSRVGAIASVLTTLDEDYESSNGIAIISSVADRLAADSDLTLEYASNPRWSADFRFVLRQAAAAGLMPAREVRNGPLEVAALYERMGVDPGYKAYTRYARDDDADGSDDWVRFLTYDAATGRVVRDEYDENNDGFIDNVYTQSYHANLYGDLYTTDRGNDGIEGSRDWDLDAFGDIVRYEERRDGELYQLETRELDPATGLYVRREVTNPVTGVHTIETWTMDDQGNRPTATIDYDGDGSPENYVTLTYDAPNSLWTGREDDTNGDGIADVATTRSFNEDGNLLSERRDDGADGSIDYVDQRTYDTGGYMTHREIDNENDGVVDVEYFWERNSRGQALSSIREENGVRVYADRATYDVAGQRLTYLRDDDGDGNFDHGYAHTYDSGGRQLEWSYDAGADGVLDRIYTYTYDSHGKLIEYQYDSNADGTPDRRNIRSYDNDGFLTAIEAMTGDVVRSVTRYEDYIAMTIAATL